MIYSSIYGDNIERRYLVLKKRIGVIGIVVESHKKSGTIVQEILADYSFLIIGRMGIPYRERGISVISLIVEGNTDDIGALTGRLGNLEGVTVKTALTSVGYQE